MLVIKSMHLIILLFWTYLELDAKQPLVVHKKLTFVTLFLFKKLLDAISYFYLFMFRSRQIQNERYKLTFSCDLKIRFT